MSQEHGGPFLESFERATMPATVKEAMVVTQAPKEPVPADINNDVDKPQAGLIEKPPKMARSNRKKK